MLWAVFAVISAVCTGWIAGEWVHRATRTNKAKRSLFSGARSASTFVGASAGGTAVGRGFGRFFRKARKDKATDLELEGHVAEMIDSVALGMRAGLSFDRAFGLYCSRFTDPLATQCKEALLSWETGLVSRADALKALSEAVNVPSFERFVSSVLRSMRYGSPIASTLQTLSAEARAEYRARIEEQVAKAPVKMLVPTAVLILPAMLILVMGPVLLEVV